MALLTIPNHFAHPNHPLQQTHEDRSQYICGACNTTGAGRRYRCQYSCNFNLHEYYATCPATFPSFMHQQGPQHQLRLVSRNLQNERSCNLCSEHIGGVFYRCMLCEFDVHPLCTQLSQHVSHALHEAHPLTLQPSSSASLCLVCKSVCRSWRYRCGTCCVDIHIQCIIARGEISQRSVPSPHPYGAYQYPYIGMPTGFIPYNNYQYPNVNLQPPGIGATYGGKLSNMMFAIVGKLSIGVVGNAIFEMMGSPSFI